MLREDKRSGESIRHSNTFFSFLDNPNTSPTVLLPIFKSILREFEGVRTKCLRKCQNEFSMGSPFSQICLLDNGNGNENGYNVDFSRFNLYFVAICLDL